MTVPFGETVPDCVALPPDAVEAVTVKELDTRDSEWVGVQEIVFPERVAPVGPEVRVKVTTLASEDVATS